MVYSTCSLSPIEDEAVVVALLRENEDLELVDTRGREEDFEDKLPGLIRRDGMSSWRVAQEVSQGEGLVGSGEDNSVKHIRWLSSPDDAEGSYKKVILPSMFPPHHEEAQKMSLDRSFRILPHDQDTGGFFVAVLRKTGKTCGKRARIYGYR